MVDFPSSPPSRPLVLPRRLLWGVGGEAFADMRRDDKVVEKRLFFDDFLVFSLIFYAFLVFSPAKCHQTWNREIPWNPNEKKPWRFIAENIQRQKVGIRPARLGGVFLETAETENWQV